jgi:hypothetical protein
MAKAKYIAPELGQAAFNCPHCLAFAKQTTAELAAYTKGVSTSVQYMNTARCDCCLKYSLWYRQLLIWPQTSIAPQPNEYTPTDILEDYEEAATLLFHSPRACAALLRLSTEKVVRHLEPSCKDLNDGIKTLVEKGLPELLQKSLDSLRVVGNNAVHPGQMDAKDSQAVALELFDAFNLVVEYTIAQPTKIKELYEKIPDGAKAAIDRRDNPPNKQS